jgi:hypothetical protein
MTEIQIHLLKQFMVGVLLRHWDLWAKDRSPDRLLKSLLRLPYEAVLWKSFSKW